MLYHVVRLRLTTVSCSIKLQDKMEELKTSVDKVAIFRGVTYLVVAVIQETLNFVVAYVAITNFFQVHVIGLQTQGRALIMTFLGSFVLTVGIARQIAHVRPGVLIAATINLANLLRHIRELSIPSQTISRESNVCLSSLTRPQSDSPTILLML